eukprot:10608079-Ditylum_brightwellii.AAC.1
MEAVCCDNVSQGNQKGVKGNTAQEAVDHVCAVLKESDWGNPSKMPAGRLKLSLAQQVWGYTKKDLPMKHQKVLPTVVYNNNLDHANMPLHRA